MHGSMNKSEDLEDEERFLNNDNEDEPKVNRGVELILRNKNRRREEPKTFQLKFGKMLSLFKREIHFLIDFQLDFKRKRS
jgi:hypothetical protein